MKTLAALVVAATLALAAGCSSGSAKPHDTPTQPADEVQGYVAELDTIFKETINPAAIDPADPDAAAPIRIALQRLRAVNPPNAFKDLTDRLIKAGEAYAAAVVREST